MADASTWSETVANMVKEDKMALLDHHLDLDYDFWTYHDIIAAILPEDALEDIPTGFQVVGHVAHLNLREAYLPYKDLIATVLLDKTPAVRTVINKIDTVGGESAFRTFQYEVLAGPDDMDVVVREQDCVYNFNYAKVYWNSRLHTEHQRLVQQQFKPGEAICDVMAGIGPFALPAGKKECFVFANDLNPESYAALEAGISTNKVGNFVKPFNVDGHAFITSATWALYNFKHQVTIRPKISRAVPRLVAKGAKGRTIVQPRWFSHYVMNLPASALEFLPNFVGVFAKAGVTERPSKMPKIHVYCFGTKANDNTEEGVKICAEISRHLGYEFRLGTAEVEGQVEVFDVRDVAPKKRMFCATFTLPESVAYRT